MTLKYITDARFTEKQTDAEFKVSIFHTIRS